MSGAKDQYITGLASSQSDWRILIVDDNMYNRSLLLSFLSPLGFKLQEAENGQAAIALWQTWKPHAILMDLRMPIMDGYEATQQIRSTLQGQGTVIIAVTAEDHYSNVMAQGFDDYIAKPFFLEVILLKLEQHLKLRYDSFD